MKKTLPNQRNGGRQPRQARSRYKVQLIFEATIRLLEKSGLDALTTNAIAASAGVSIGTLYQFFENKEAILDSLADREMADMSNHVTRIMEDKGILKTHDRIASLVQTVAASYGARQGAHRLLLEYSLTHGSSRLSPLLARVMAHLSRQRDSGPITQAMAGADAFVLTQAFTGVLRAMIRESSNIPPQEEITEALTRLVTKFAMPV